EAAEPSGRIRSEITPVRAGGGGPQRPGGEGRVLRRGHEPFERPGRKGQRAGKYLVKRLDLLLKGRGLFLRLLLRGLRTPLASFCVVGHAATLPACSDKTGVSPQVTGRGGCGPG